MLFYPNRNTAAVCPGSESELVVGVVVELKMLSPHLTTPSGGAPRSGLRRMIPGPPRHALARNTLLPLKEPCVCNMSSQTIPETTDYPALSLGYAASSCTSVNIVGLDVKVYGLEEAKSSLLPLAAIVSYSARPRP